MSYCCNAREIEGERERGRDRGGGCLFFGGGVGYRWGVLVCVWYGVCVCV